MANEGFEGAIEEAKKLEKKLVDYTPYQGEIDVEKTMDLDPKDYVDLNYQDLINQYERCEKILSTTELGILAKTETAGEAPMTTAETGEVESKLREMTTETLKTAQEVAKEEITIEKVAPPVETPKPEPQKTIEFETHSAQTIEIEKPQPVANEEAAEAAPERSAEKIEEPKVEVPAEKKMIVATVPPALSEGPDKAGSKRYEQMEEQIRAAVGEKADEMTVKKKMLELTKQLFKEKSFNKREELKLQITVLKNMLSGSQAAPSRARAAAKPRDDTHDRMFEAVLGSEQTELAQTKDSIIDSYNQKVAEIKKKFYEDVSASEDPSKRKEIFEAFVFSVTSLVEQLPEVIEKYKDFTVKKHASEMEKLRDSLTPDEKPVQKKVEERLDYIKNSYGQEFAAVKGIIGRNIENLIEVAGSEIFKKEEMPKETEARTYEVIKEINDTDEGTLLYFLHSKDPDTYKQYERKLLSKAEAIFKSKELMAKEKGLSDSMVTKYFSQTEG